MFSLNRVSLIIQQLKTLSCIKQLERQLNPPNSKVVPVQALNFLKRIPLTSHFKSVVFRFNKFYFLKHILKYKRNKHRTKHLKIKERDPWCPLLICGTKLPQTALFPGELVSDPGNYRVFQLHHSLPCKFFKFGGWGTHTQVLLPIYFERQPNLIFSPLAINKIQLLLLSQLPGTVLSVLYIIPHLIPIGLWCMHYRYQFRKETTVSCPLQGHMTSM